ncbi:MAG: hypothetical protein Q7S92_02065 [Candidatus Diapherotrites archaeon]|nr:hypothetical protein [Candidatus Diapherotrites archaeon]
MLEYVGIAGLLLLLLAWIPETLEVIRLRKTEMEIKFILIYTLGSVFLAVHSFLLKDSIFLILNVLIVFSTLINAYYFFRIPKK